MNDTVAKRLVKISELLEKTLESLDSVMNEFIETVRELPTNEQIEFNKILRNFVYHMKGSLTDLECLLIPCKDHTQEYTV